MINVEAVRITDKHAITKGEAEQIQAVQFVDPPSSLILLPDVPEGADYWLVNGIILVTQSQVDLARHKANVRRAYTIAKEINRLEAERDRLADEIGAYILQSPPLTDRV